MNLIGQYGEVNMIDFTNANPLPAVEVYKKRLGISWTKKTDSRQKNQWVKSLCPMDRVMVIEKRNN